MILTVFLFRDLVCTLITAILRHNSLSIKKEYRLVI